MRQKRLKYPITKSCVFHYDLYFSCRRIRLAFHSEKPFVSFSDKTLCPLTIIRTFCSLQRKTTRENQLMIRKHNHI